jgi:hypothetical protein
MMVTSISSSPQASISINRYQARARAELDPGLFYAQVSGKTPSRHLVNKE